MRSAAAPAEASGWASMTVIQGEWVRFRPAGIQPLAADRVSGRHVPPGKPNDALEAPPITFFDAMSGVGSMCDECYVYTRSALWCHTIGMPDMTVIGAVSTFVAGRLSGRHL